MPQKVTALITGAGRGIGKRLAIGFAKTGIRVGLLGRNQGELDLTKLEIEDTGGLAHILRADVREFTQIAASVGRLEEVGGSVHALVANAAVLGPIGPFAGNRPRDWKEVFDTNVLGVMNACRAVLPQMLARRSGKIVVISDNSAAIPRPNFAAYAASKAAVARFVECLAEEVRDHNIQVNSLAPGHANTSMTDEILAAEERAGAKELEDAEKTQMTGGVPAEKQIQLALFLISERSNHLTGKFISVADDWKKLERENTRPDAFTLRRHLR